MFDVLNHLFMKDKIITHDTRAQEERNLQANTGKKQIQMQKCDRSMQNERQGYRQGHKHTASNTS